MAFASKSKKERDQLVAQIGRMEKAKAISDPAERAAKSREADTGLLKLLRGHPVAALVCGFERKRLHGDGAATLSTE